MPEILPFAGLALKARRHWYAGPMFRGQPDPPDSIPHCGGYLTALYQGGQQLHRQRVNSGDLNTYGQPIRFTKVGVVCNQCGTAWLSQDLVVPGLSGTYLEFDLD